MTVYQLINSTRIYTQISIFSRVTTHPVHIHRHLIGRVCILRVNQQHVRIVNDDASRRLLGSIGDRGLEARNRGTGHQSDQRCGQGSCSNGQFDQYKEEIIHLIEKNHLTWNSDYCFPDGKQESKSLYRSEKWLYFGLKTHLWWIIIYLNCITTVLFDANLSIFVKQQMYNRCISGHSLVRVISSIEFKVMIYYQDYFLIPVTLIYRLWLLFFMSKSVVATTTTVTRKQVAEKPHHYTTLQFRFSTMIPMMCGIHIAAS